MVKAIIYIEGGASGPHSKNLNIRCQKAFHALLDRMGLQRKPRLKACGGRNAVYDDFCTAHAAKREDFVSMWIDSEEPMKDIEAAWKHLAEVTTVAAWKKPEDVEDEQVLFMTTCMETWIVADRKALKRHFGHKLHENALPPPNDLESRDRHDVQERLERATKDCQNAYAKGKRSFEALEEVSPDALQELPSFCRVQRILKKRL
ncbi:MAG TPA: hypothetical protein DDZ88_12045 [Verrucomicrobiales bacterium]|nr:hypothetical protein [Verrucomicrobiales bacterium]